MSPMAPPEPAELRSLWDIAERFDAAKAKWCRSAGENLEAAGGVEPPMEILQTSALPLGYAASAQALPHNDEKQTTEHMASVLCLTP
jgi:hypothetical protein